MPLQKGGSREAFRSNVAEMLRSWKSKGSLGNDAIKSYGKARKKALAIAFRVKREAGGE